jgi:hypothetical protein
MTLEHCRSSSLCHAAGRKAHCYVRRAASPPAESSRPFQDVKGWPSCSTGWLACTRHACEPLVWRRALSAACGVAAHVRGHGARRRLHRRAHAQVHEGLPVRFLSTVTHTCMQQHGCRSTARVRWRVCGPGQSGTPKAWAPQRTSGACVPRAQHAAGRRPRAVPGYDTLLLRTYFFAYDLVPVCPWLQHVRPGEEPRELERPGAAAPTHPGHRGGGAPERRRPGAAPARCTALQAARAPACVQGLSGGPGRAALQPGLEWSTVGSVVCCCRARAARAWRSSEACMCPFSLPCAVLARLLSAPFVVRPAACRMAGRAVLGAYGLRGLVRPCRARLEGPCTAGAVVATRRLAVCMAYG